MPFPRLPAPPIARLAPVLLAWSVLAAVVAPAGLPAPPESGGPAYEIRRPVSSREPVTASPAAPAGQEASPAMSVAGPDSGRSGLPEAGQHPPSARGVAGISGTGADGVALPASRPGRPARVEEVVRIGMPRDELLGRLGPPEQARTGPGGAEALRYGQAWVVLERGQVGCVRTRLEHVARYDSDCHCAGFADGFLLR